MLFSVDLVWKPEFFWAVSDRKKYVSVESVGKILPSKAGAYSALVFILLDHGEKGDPQPTEKEFAS